MTSKKYLDQAHHNIQFLKELDAKQSENFFDWKITVCFYAALHLMKALLLEKYNVEINSHKDIKEEIFNRVKRECFSSYRNLYRSCHDARYDGFESDEVFIESNRREYIECKLRLEYILKYCKGKGLNIDNSLLPL
ncbi:hypothetical protein [Ekhidna sp.]